MAYAIIEPSGCGIHKDRVKLRIDLFLNPDDPHYDKHHVFVPVFPEEGYPGEVDKEGAPKDQKDFDAWVESLPHIWQNNPFHSHFIYPDKSASDADIKQQIDRTLTYFYQFHQACWDADKEFGDEWVKVPKRKGDVRCPFERGDPKDLTANEVRVRDILSRVKDFQVGKKISGDFELPRDEGTIDIGNEASDRASLNQLTTDSIVAYENTANADGTLDTFQVFFEAVGPAGSGVKVGTIHGTWSYPYTMTCRDFETWGDVPDGSQQTLTGASCDVITGDYVALYATTGWISADFGGGARGKADTDILIVDAENDLTSGYSTVISLYGTGTEAGAGWSHDFNGVSNASIGNIMGVTLANIGNVNGVA